MLVDSSAVNNQDGAVKAHCGETAPLVSAQNKQKWSESLNLSDIHCDTFGAVTCVANCCLMNSRKTKSRCIHATSGFLRGEKQAFHLLKGRQYSIMCQNRIRGLLNLQPCQRKMLYFAYAANLFSLSLHNIICSVCAHACAIFSRLLFDVSESA